MKSIVAIALGVASLGILWYIGSFVIMALGHIVSFLLPVIIGIVVVGLIMAFIART